MATKIERTPLEPPNPHATGRTPLEPPNPHLILDDLRASLGSLRALAAQDPNATDYSVIADQIEAAITKLELLAKRSDAT